MSSPTPNILLIEPDKVLGTIIKESFEAQGYRVSWCRSAQSALNSLDKIIPGVIILEPQLGAHNGIEFLYEMRSYMEWRYLPVIIHTFNNRVAEKVFEQAFDQLNVRAVLYKPRTSTVVLSKTIRQFLPLSHNYSGVLEYKNE